MEYQKLLNESQTKIETLGMILKKEKEQLNSKITDLVEKNESDTTQYEQKLLELRENFELRLKEHEKWNKRLEEENNSLKNIIEIIKVKSEQNLNSKKAKSTKIQGDLSNDVVIDESVASDTRNLLGQLREMMMEMREMKVENLEVQSFHAKEKEVRGWLNFYLKIKNFNIYLKHFVTLIIV